MISFKKYMQENESLLSTEDNENNILEKIIKIAWDKHTSKTKQFLHELSKLDSEIKLLFNKIKDVKITQDKEPLGPQDYVRPPIADTGFDASNQNSL